MRRKTIQFGRLRDYPAAFGIALIANALFFFSFQSTFPVLPRYIAEVVLKQPPENVGGQVGLATTVTALIAVFVRIPSGRLADRFGRQRFMFVGALCFAVAPLIYEASRGMPVLLVGRVVQGLGLGMFTTAFQALATELAPQTRRGEALGLAGASTSIAFVSAPLVADWLATNRGYTLMFSVTAAAGASSVVMVALIAALPRRRYTPPVPIASRPSSLSEGADRADNLEPTNQDGLRLVLAQTGVRAGLLTMAALGIPFGAFITFLPLFAEKQQMSGVGAVFSVYAATVFFAQPLAGRLTDRVGRSRVIFPGLAITALGTGVLALDGSLIVFALAGVIIGVGGGLVRGGVDPLVQDSVPPSLRSTAVALQYTSFDFLIGAGSYPVGLLASAIGYGVTFVLTGVMCLTGGAGMVFILRRARME